MSAERFSSDVMALELEKLIVSKYEWLNRFSEGRNKRPEHEIDRVKREAAVLSQARADYHKKHEREKVALSTK